MGKSRPDAPYAAFGERLRLAREHAGLTQVQLVARMGVVRGKEIDQAHYSKWETGQHLPRYEDYWAALVSALGVSRLWLQHDLNAEAPKWLGKTRQLHRTGARAARPLHRRRDKEA